MPFCANCGNLLNDNAKFCPNCGTPTKDTTINTEKRTHVFDGVIHKCPNCGEIINSFVYCCPSCGFELRDTQIATSIKEFANKLETYTISDQRSMFIRNFPIPNTKEDLFEFMLLSVANLSQNQQNISFDAWISKFEQCYNKALLVFTNDNECKKVKEIYEKGKRIIGVEKKKKRVPKIRKMGIALAIIASVFLLFILFAGSSFLANPRLLVTASLMYIASVLTLQYIEKDKLKTAVFISYWVNIITNFIFIFWAKGHLLIVLTFIFFMIFFLYEKDGKATIVSKHI